MSTWRDQIEVHPAADIFPMMSESEISELASDIRENGQRVGVILWTPERPEDVGPRKGPKKLYMIDGRNRLEAIERAYDDAEDRENAIYSALSYDWRDGGSAKLIYGDEDPCEVAVSANIRRRHLTTEQKREIIAELLKAHPERSDRATAKIADSNPNTVARVRKGLEGTGDVSRRDTRTDAVGRQQPATKLLKRLVDIDGFEDTARQLIDDEAQRHKERLATLGTRFPAEIEAAQARIDKAAEETMRRVMDGRIAPKDIRGELEVNIYRFAREAKREAPLFEQFAQRLAGDLARMREQLLREDSAGARLAEIERALPDLTLPYDKRAVDRIAYELEALGKEVRDRVEGWRKRLARRSINNFAEATSAADAAAANATS